MAFRRVLENLKMVSTENVEFEGVAKQIAEIHQEITGGKVGMSHMHIEFWYMGHDRTGGNFNWFQGDGVTSMAHPDFDDLEWGQCVEKEYPFGRRIKTLLKLAREQDLKGNVPVRNVYDMKVYSDGRYEFQFYHDADLVADQKARSEEAEQILATHHQDLQVENNPEDGNFPDQSSQSVSRENLEKYEILKEKIYRKADNIWHAEVFLRYQAALVAPDDWEEVRIEMIKQDENSTRMNQWVKLKGEVDFQQLYGINSMDVVDAIEHWRVRKDEGQHRHRNIRFTFTPEDVEMYNEMRYEWDVS